MIGAGYVGLVSAACFAEFGWDVTCVDKDIDRIARLKRGEVPIYEPGLDELLERNMSGGRIVFTSLLSEAVRTHRSGRRRHPSRQDGLRAWRDIQTQHRRYARTPSLVIIPMLQARGARIRAYDPQGRCKGEELLAGVEWCANALEAAEGADVLVVLTEWNEFRALDLERGRESMLGNVLVDLRNVYPEEVAEKAGFLYHGIGCKQPSRPLDSRGTFVAKVGYRVTH